MPSRSRLIESFRRSQLQPQFFVADNFNFQNVPSPGNRPGSSFHAFYRAGNDRKNIVPLWRTLAHFGCRLASLQLIGPHTSPPSTANQTFVSKWSNSPLVFYERSVHVFRCACCGMESDTAMPFFFFFLSFFFNKNKRNNCTFRRNQASPALALDRFY